jgi:hypothetical protein
VLENLTHPYIEIQLVYEYQRKILTKSVIKTPGRPTAYHQSEETNAVYCDTRRHTQHVVPDCERWLSYRPSSAQCPLARYANIHRVYYSNVAHLGYCQDKLSSALMTYADVQSIHQRSALPLPELTMCFF